MKRKLNQDDIPESIQEPQQSASTTNFESFQLDPRLLQAITKAGFLKPTSIQSRAIPPALQGSDILARAKTGTGKTAAYLLPVLQSILLAKSSVVTGASALILVPTRELAAQVQRHVQIFTQFCAKDVQTVNLALDASENALRAQLASKPDIIIATPARAKQHIERKNLGVDSLRWIVVDEADLVMSYGYKDDFQAIVKQVPTQGLQTFLASATLTTEVDELNMLFCRNPLVVDMQDEERKEQPTVSQYVVKCGEDEKFLLLIAVFKLKLITGKCIIFVGDVDRSYKVKMLLEQFGIRSCVLNSELPINSRLHVVEEFNKGIYDIVIATDDIDAASAKHIKAPASRDAEHPVERSEGKINSKISGHVDDSKHESQRKKGKRDANYGISRGIDFQHVTCVLNFDLPTSARSYTHRIGRTGRLGQSGLALSFAVPSAEYRKHKMLSFPSTQHDEAVLVAISTAQEKRGNKVGDYAFDMQPLQGFWYRVSSALKVVTPGAVRQARLRELREELLKSEKLKRHLEENPEDLKWLRHDQETKVAKFHPHLKTLPEYLLPVNGGSPPALADVGFVGSGRQSENRIRRARQFNKLRKNPRKRANPLKTFKGRKA